MRLFFYLKHFPLYDSPCEEGVSKAVHGLATGLAAIGQSVTILGEGPIAGRRRSEFGYDICVFPAPNTHPSVRLSPDLLAYVKMTMGSDDRVILNGIFHRSVAVFARVLKQRSIPYIVAPHDPYHPAIFQRNKLLKTIYWFLQEAPLLRSAWAVQILDDRHQQYLRDRGIQTPTIALPNGFDVADVVPESSLEWRSDGLPRIYFLGRFDTYNKGLDLLVMTIAELLKTQPLQLTLQGPEWGDRETLRSQVQELGIQEHVTFLEPDYECCPAELTMQHDIFCVPSRFEGFSLSALEAMLGGRVIVISEVAGLAPHVEASGSGKVVQPTIESIVLALSELLSCRDRWPEMGKAGRDYVLKTLKWETIAQSAALAYGITADGITADVTMPVNSAIASSMSK
jgi:glycosyltransferase involved in cell wall biosynthesis